MKSFRSAANPGLLVPAAVLVFCLFLPTGMKDRNWVPVIGWGEGIVSSYCMKNVKEAQSAYLVACAFDSVVAIARSGETSASIFGVGGAVTPGEILSPAHDTIKTLASYYYSAILTLMAERQAMGAITWLCIRIALPAAMLCLIFSLFVSRCAGQFKRAGIWLCKCAIGLWLFLPLSAAIAECVDAMYIAPSYDAHVKTVKAEVGSIFGISAEESEKAGLDELAGMAGKRLASTQGPGLKDRVKSIFANIKGISVNMDGVSGILLIMFSQTIVLVWIIPAFVMFMLIGLWFAIMRARN